MANDNIFQQYLRAPKSVLEYTADLDAADQRKQVLKQNALELAASQQKLDDGTRSTQRQEQLRGALSGLGSGATDEDRIRVMRDTSTPEGFAAADSLEKALGERAKSKAAADKDRADSDKTNLARDIALHAFHAQKLAQVQTPADADAWAQEGHAMGLFNEPGQFERGMAMIQQASQNPQAFAQWKEGAMQGGQSITDQLKQKLEQAKADEAARHNKSSEGITIRGQNMLDGRAREVNRLKGEENRINSAGIVGKRIQDVELKLQDDYRAESKGWSETSTSMKKILGAIETADKNPGSALAAGTAFMKLLDPNSVVRESELGMALNASGWFDRATNIASTLQSGKVMTASQKANLRAAANNLFDEAKSAQLEVDSAYRQRAVDYGANPDRVIVNRGQNAARPGALAAPDIQAAADAILRGDKK